MIEGLLSALCPMHLRLGPDMRISSMGPTAAKVLGSAATGRAVLDIMECQRPSGILDSGELAAMAGERLQFRLREPPGTLLVGQLIAENGSGWILDLGLGFAVERAVRDHGLLSTDFAPTDPSVEMLFLIEANAVALQASRTLNTRLRVAQLTAQEEAFTDTLTGLSNRRAFDHIAERVAMSRRAFSVMQIDLDRFKAVNDRQGHAAGDAVLRRVGAILSSAVRENDLAARVGGDEFVLLFPDLVDADRLHGLAGRLIALIEEPLTFDGMVSRISASIGIAFWPGGGQATMETVLEKADAALYRAKRAGRGRAFLSDFSPSSVPFNLADTAALSAR